MVILDEFAFEHVYDVEMPFEPDSVFDCGGHIGLFSLLAARKYRGAPIVTFEPNPRNLKWLKRNIALNQINIELVEAAVSISEGTEWFDAGISHGGHLLSGPEVGPADNKSPEAAPANASAPASRYEVRVVNFLDFFESRKVSKPLLKIDIEGEEMRLIPPLIRVLPRKCAIFFETHAGQPAWDTISTMLSDNGFSVTKRSSWEYLTMGLAVRSET